MSPDMPWWFPFLLIAIVAFGTWRLAAGYQECMESGHHMVNHTIIRPSWWYCVGK